MATKLSILPIGILLLLGPDPGMARDGALRPHHGRRDVCWSEPPNLAGSMVRSDIIAEYGVDMETANEIMIEAGEMRIELARWWGGYVEQNMYTVEGFSLRIYQTDPTVPCLPGLLLMEAVVEGNANEVVYGYHNANPRYEYFAPFHVTLQGPAVYWFVVQAWSHPVPPNMWGRLEATDVTGCSSAFRGAYFAFPDWTPVDPLFGHPWDASQEFECSSPPVPTVTTSWGAIKALYR